MIALMARNVLERHCGARNGSGVDLNEEAPCNSPAIYEM